MVLKTVSDLPKRLHLIEGDIELPQLGLSDRNFRQLARSIHQIYHVAASVHLTGRLEVLRKTNLFGTSQVLLLAQQAHHLGVLKRFNYLSTAYVAGKRFGKIAESELDCGQDFTNTYERVKFETEMLVEAQKPHLPHHHFSPQYRGGGCPDRLDQCF